MNIPSVHDATASSVSPSVLPSRLESVRLSLGCDRLAVVRRVASADPTAAPSFVVLGQVDSSGPVHPPEASLPLEFALELAAHARPLEYRLDRSSGEWNARLRRWELGWIAGWPLPSDRLPTIFFVATSTGLHDPGPVRRDVARAGMEALARLLAPPLWMPVGATRAPSPTDGGEPAPERSDAEPTYADLLAELEREILMGALLAAEGNKSEAARKLRISRQGLYRKLRRHGLLPRDRRALDSGSGDD